MKKENLLLHSIQFCFLFLNVSHVNYKSIESHCICISYFMPYPFHYFHFSFFFLSIYLHHLLIGNCLRYL